MKVLYTAAEAAPFFKTGGLGDVAYALPKEIAKDSSIDIRVALPYYSSIPEEYSEQIEDVRHFRFQLGNKNVYCGIKQLELDGVIYYFIDNLAYFDRPELYGQWDDGERFAYFSLAIIEMLEVIEWIPDVIHTNDWQTAMIPVMLVDRYHWKEPLKDIRKVISIHNIRFQGIYPPNILQNVFGTGFNTFTEDGVRDNGNVNYLKGGINFSDRVTTVSPTYAEEIMTPEFGEGLDAVIRHNGWKVRGIINGIDYDLNDPGTDPHLSYHYNADDLSNKFKNKEALQEELGLPVDKDIFMIGVVSRLTDQKGFQLVEAALEELLQTEVQIVVLGTGEPQFEHSFRYFQDRYPDKMRALIQFDIGLAQRIYAASDAFLMPSAFEPCGLSQMISMRYGTLPIVHETGGLQDTVQPYNQYTGEGTGFTFSRFDRDDMLPAIYHAMHVYYNDKKAWYGMVDQAMNADFTWRDPAKEYIQIYREITGIED
ncbi:glycogen synthase GlgA [Aerococcaceae bacterium DSM 111020]|nr:glycogen synthase GlgA [Aerococcaceae bacterium DSM 111020]